MSKYRVYQSLVWNSIMDSQCCICLDAMNQNNSVITKCGHTFHTGCLCKIRDFTCPLCRQDISDCHVFEHDSDVNLEPFIWDREMYILPKTKLSLETIHDIYLELHRDLRMAACLKLPQQVHDTRRRRIRSVEMYCAINYGVELK